MNKKQVPIDHIYVHPGGLKFTYFDQKLTVLLFIYTRGLVYLCQVVMSRDSTAQALWHVHGDVPGERQVWFRWETLAIIKNDLKYWCLDNTYHISAIKWCKAATLWHSQQSIIVFLGDESSNNREYLSVSPPQGVKYPYFDPKIPKILAFC